MECGKFVFWWDGEYEGSCELPKGHDPADVHYDGMSWFDDDNEQVPDEGVPPTLLALAEKERS